MIPTPIPSPLVVQIITDNQTPWWASGALTGAFLLIVAIIAFLSLKASDKRKLEREDQRQWDILIKDAYLQAASDISSILQLTLKQYETDSPGVSLAKATQARDRLQNRGREFHLIAPKASEAMDDVAHKAATLISQWSGDFVWDIQRQDLIVARDRLFTQVKNTLRLDFDPSVDPIRRNTRPHTRK